MEQKLLEWMIFLWSRKYIYSLAIVDRVRTYCHLGVLRKHLACFLTCCSRPFSVATSKCTINTKCHQTPSFQPYIMPFAQGFCSVIDHPCSAGGGAEAKMPARHGLAVELEPNFSTCSGELCLLWGHFHTRCCPCVHNYCQLPPVLYSCVKTFLLNVKASYETVW